MSRSPATVRSTLLHPLRPGMRAWVAGMSNESALLREEFAREPQRAAGVTFMGVHFPGIDTTDYLGVHPEARQTGFFMTPHLRAGMRERRANLVPLDYLGLTRLLRDMEPVDAAIAQLSLPDASGWCSAGLSSDFMPLVWPRARMRLAHLNPRMPRTRGSFRVHVSDLDRAVEADLPLLEYRERPAGPVEAAIAAHLYPLVRDGDTLQFGIGGVPMAIAASLASHRRLKVHSGMLGGAVRKLWESGALERDAQVVGGVLLGDSAFHEFVRDFEPLWLTDVRRTHDVDHLAATPGFVAVNSAVEVDLFGQVNSERAHGGIQAGAGGLPAFAQAAQRSVGGQLIICLPATAKRGTVPRIVPALGSDALCTVPRHLADTVVTEHGVARVRDLPMDARAEALIAIAAPEHRAELADAWDALRRTL